MRPAFSPGRIQTFIPSLPKASSQDAPRWSPDEKLQTTPEPMRVVVREDPAPGDVSHIGEARFEDARSLAAARRSRIGGYLKMPFEAVRALGKKVILLDKIVEGTDLILRVRLFPVPQGQLR